jgi:hypothetical protein
MADGARFCLQAAASQCVRCLSLLTAAAAAALLSGGTTNERGALTTTTTHLSVVQKGKGGVGVGGRNGVLVGAV